MNNSSPNLLANHQQARKIFLLIRYRFILAHVFSRLSHVQPRPNPEIGGGEAFTGSLTGASSSSLTRVCYLLLVSANVVIHRVCQEGSETPIPVETRDHVSSGPQTDPEPPQLVDEMQGSAAPSTPGIMDDRAQEDIPEEGMQIDSTADNFVVTDPVDVRIDGDNIEQSLREEEQEEEASKDEGDKAEHDDIDIKRDISEEQTMSGEHQQEEDKRGLAQEPSNVAEDQQVAESGILPLSLEEQAQEIADEIRQQTGDETSEEQEPVQTTRRNVSFHELHTGVLTSLIQVLLVIDLRCLHLQSPAKPADKCELLNTTFNPMPRGRLNIKRSVLHLQSQLNPSMPAVVCSPSFHSISIY